jgi:hypothetical protein
MKILRARKKILICKCNIRCIVDINLLIILSLKIFIMQFITLLIYNVNVAWYRYFAWSLYVHKFIASEYVVY